MLPEGLRRQPKARSPASLRQGASQTFFQQIYVFTAPIERLVIFHDLPWRLDATAIYKFDRAWLAQIGWAGDLKAKLRYTWESNSVADWHNDLLAPFTPAVSANALWLGYNNPNYNVQMIAGSFITTW